MISNNRAETRGPRYVLALYDGPQHVGYAPRQGAHVLGRPDDPAIDLFHSELGVRSQARVRAIQFAPLTVAPYDLARRGLLDPIPRSEKPEEPSMLKDEENPGDMARFGRSETDSKMIADFRRSNVRGAFQPAIIALAETQRELARLIAVLVGSWEG